MPHQALSTYIQNQVRHQIYIFAEQVLIDDLDREKFPFLEDENVGIMNIEIFFGNDVAVYYQFVKWTTYLMFFDHPEFFSVRCSLDYRILIDLSKSWNDPNFALVNIIEVKDCN